MTPEPNAVSGVWCDARKVLMRFVWAAICLIVWPVYYVALFVRWLVPWPLWPLDRAWTANDRLIRALRSPPFVDRLRA